MTGKSNYSGLISQQKWDETGLPMRTIRLDVPNGASKHRSLK
jgi:hypothetical protein